MLTESADKWLCVCLWHLVLSNPPRDATRPGAKARLGTLTFNSAVKKKGLSKNHRDDNVFYDHKLEGKRAFQTTCWITSILWSSNNRSRAASIPSTEVM